METQNPACIKLNETMDALKIQFIETVITDVWKKDLEDY